MHHLRAEQLADWLDDDEQPQPLLLDVREPWEFELCHLDGAQLLPMNAVPAQLEQLRADAGARPIVCICHHGARSLQVGQFLEQRGFDGVCNLDGGIDAWAQQVDPTLARY